MKETCKSLNARPTIGLVVCKPLNDPRIFQVWSGVSDVTLQRRVNLICFPIELTHTGRQQDEVLLHLISAKSLDGLALFRWLDTKEEFEQFYAPYKPLPVVAISRTFEGFGGVMEDNYQGMRNAMRHLVEKHGYRRIAYIHGPEHCQPSEDRYRGYVDILKESDIALDPKLIIPRVPDSTFVTPQRGAEAISILIDERKLRPKVDFEAIVVRSDDLATGAMQELRRRGVQVPYDVAVVGYDNTELCRTTTPPMTSASLPFYEIARQSTEMLLDMMDGTREPEHIRLPGALIVRQSCGCLPPIVKHAVASIKTTETDCAKTTLNRQRETLLSEIKDAVGDATLAAGWVDNLLQRFIAELNGDTPGIFLQQLDTILRQVIENGKDVSIWQNAISVLYQYASHSRNRTPSCHAENLCQQARVMVQELTQWAQARQSAKETEQASALRRIGQSLITTFDVAELMDVLARELPRLGFPSCYLSVYDDPASPAGTARLMLAYNEHGRIALEPEGQPFPALQVVPEGMFPQDRDFSMVVEPLYFRGEQIGFAVFEAGPREGTIYDILRGEISSALQGALLVKRVRERSAELARQKYILDTFMASVPDTIYFKDRESRLTKVNRAHALRTGFQHPSELVGKTDFDFFPEEQARPKYEQEQEIIRSGQPVLAVAEPDGEGHWSLTTKMPLRDEHGDIIGTFGISRDITPLKQAEAEILALNEQLKDENRHMRTEMEVARRIQTSLLPQHIKNLHPDFDMAAVMLPADEVGGDYYDITLDREDNLWCGIGDVSGHGVTPGLIMMMAQTAHTAITANYQASARDIVVMINNVLYKNVQGRLQEDHFMTFSALKYLENGRFQHAGAHLDLIVYRQHSRSCERIPTPGTWLNFLPDISHATENSELTLNIGDTLVLYTDGLTEVWDHRENMLDTEGFMEIIQYHAEKEVETLRDAIIADVMAWCQHKRDDDMTLVVARRIQ